MTPVTAAEAGDNEDSESEYSELSWSVQVCALEIPGVDIAVACECRLVSCYENEKCQLLLIANQLEIKLNLSQA